MANEVVEFKRGRDGFSTGELGQYFTATAIADLTGHRADYMRSRVLDDEFYAQLIIDYLCEFGSVPFREIDAFLRDKLPDSFSEEQRDNKVRNLLARLRKDGTIHSVGSTRAARWQLKLSRIK